MNQHGFRYLLLMLLLWGVSGGLLADIQVPNYDFSTATIEPFYPGASVEKIKSDKAIQSEIYEDAGNLKTYKFKLKKANYNLDIFAQAKDDKITSMFVRLPQYFNHDLVLTDLQKKYKKQDKFVRKDLSALYVWMNRDGSNIIYHGTCSLSCFPMFIEVVNTDRAVIPFYQKMNLAIPKW